MAGQLAGGTANDNTPAWYRGGADLQPFDVVDAFGLDFFTGTALAYVCRAGRKPGVPKADDLRTAIRMLQEAVDREPPPPSVPATGGGSGGAGPTGDAVVSATRTTVIRGGGGNGGAASVEPPPPTF